MATACDNRVFGKKASRPVLILASGDRVRHMTIRPWMVAAGATLLIILSTGYFAATAYLVMRDDLIGGSLARQSRIRQAYEERISGLRAQIDRITSRQLIDQQLVEDKVKQLVEQQNALLSQHGKLGNLLQRAQASGLTTETTVQTAQGQAQAYQPITTDEPTARNRALKAIERLIMPEITPASERDGKGAKLGFLPLRDQPLPAKTAGEKTARALLQVTQSLRSIEHEQLARIRDLTATADETTDAMTSIMRRTGISVPPPQAAKNEDGGIGGPFVEPAAADPFDSQLDQLDAALTRLETVRQTAVSLPYGNPAPGHDITSRFGNRIDPFLGRLALHAGIDFDAETGATVRATGAGRVTVAGDSSGYGNMVEIDHGHGITTRYGHLSRILVSEGDLVSSGDIIGRAGSTGRSTGPHVHYEVRRDGAAIDPIHFLNAGLKLTSYLN
ncbi:M23 family metallopeptidase [Neorhizobium galegae]|uniref:M23 family metallopeptidase n=1 Tax=Neorhizobium galegae TaxID=399 RepID=UPI003D7C2FB4